MRVEAAGSAGRRARPSASPPLSPQIEAETAPFLADRLKVWMLPTLALMVGGEAKSYVVGFDTLPGGVDCAPAALEARLVEEGVLFEAGAGAPRTATAPRRATVRRGERRDSDEDSDFD